MQAFGFVIARQGRHRAARRARPPAVCLSARHRFRVWGSALLLGGVSLLALSCTARADDTAEDLKQLRAEIQKELAALKKREQQLHQEFLRLDQKSQLLDEQLCKLRAAGTGPGSGNSDADGGAAPSRSVRASPFIEYPSLRECSSTARCLGGRRHRHRALVKVRMS